MIFWEPLGRSHTWQIHRSIETPVEAFIIETLLLSKRTGNSMEIVEHVVTNQPQKRFYNNLLPKWARGALCKAPRGDFSVQQVHATTVKA